VDSTPRSLSVSQIDYRLRPESLLGGRCVSRGFPSARFPAFISARADSHVSKFSGTGLAAFVSVSHFASGLNTKGYLNGPSRAPRRVSDVSHRAFAELLPRIHHFQPAFVRKLSRQHGAHVLRLHSGHARTRRLSGRTRD
jgi:hypothetical protein